MSDDRNITLISLNDYLATGVRLLSAGLNRKGYRTNIVFYKNMVNSRHPFSEKKDEDLLIELLSRLRSEMVGISVCSPYLNIAVKITERIREELRTPVLWGGIHPTLMPEESIKKCDMLSLGEADLSFPDMLGRFFSGSSYTGSSGFWFRKKGTIIKNPPLPPPRDLNILPYPDYSNKNKYFIEANMIYPWDPALNPDRDDHHISVGSWRKGLIAIKNEYYTLASRGCPFKCSYCCNSFFTRLHGDTGYVRWRSVDHVIGELSEITGRFPNINRIQFYDALFPWGREWTKEFCRKYREKIGRPFYVSAHPALLKEENVTALKAAGVEIIGFGIESGSERIRKSIYNRDVSDKSILEGARIIRKHNISSHYYIMLDNPFETTKDKESGIDLLLKIPRPYILIIHALFLFPGVEVTKTVLKKISGIEDENDIKNWVLEQAKSGMDLTRPIKDVFWKSIYSLAPKKYVPVTLIRFLSRSAFLRRYPLPLVLFAKFCDYLKFSYAALRRLAKRDINWKNIKNNLSLKQFADIYH